MSLTAAHNIGLGCMRRCGVPFGETVPAAFSPQEEEDDSGCGFLGYHCWDDAAKSVGEFVIDHRWQIVGAGGFIACEVITAGAGTGGCVAGAGAVIAIGKEAEITYREITSDDPDPHRWLDNTTYNLVTSVPGFVRYGGLGDAYSAGCASSPMCSSPYADDPWDPTDDPGWFG